MTITAKYPGRCAECGGPIRPGQQIEWDRDTRATRHVKCPTGAAENLGPTTPVEEAPIRLYFIDHGPVAGTTLRDPKHGLVTVVRVTSRFVSQDEVDDNDDFRGGGEAFREIRCYCRPATEAEAAPVLAKEANAAAEAEAKARAEAERKTADAATAERVKVLLAGLVETDSNFVLPDEVGDEVARWTDQWGNARVLYSHADGCYIEQMFSAFGDDSRVLLHGTREAVEAAWRAWMAAYPAEAPTPEQAREWLEKCRGCVGTAFHEWRAAQE